MNDIDIDYMVLILAIYKKKPLETIDDVLATLEQSGTFSIEYSKSMVEKLIEDKLIKNGWLTFLGEAQAVKAEQFFKI